MSFRYSIYKVQISSRSRCELCHSITLSSVCQEVFSLFFGFSRDFHHPPARLRGVHRKACIYYHAHRPFVKPFLPIFPLFPFLFLSRTLVCEGWTNIVVLFSPAGQIGADLGKGIGGIQAGFFPSGKIAQADDAPQAAVLHDGEAADLLPAHQMSSGRGLHGR